MAKPKAATKPKAAPSSKPKAAPTKPKSCRNVGDNLNGDRIYVSCQKPGKWVLFRKSNQHRGHKTKADKDAYAVIEKTYTNLQK